MAGDERRGRRDADAGAGRPARRVRHVVTASVEAPGPLEPARAPACAPAIGRRAQAIPTADAPLVVGSRADDASTRPSPAREPDTAAAPVATSSTRRRGGTPAGPRRRRARSPRPIPARKAKAKAATKVAAKRHAPRRRPEQAEGRRPDRASRRGPRGARPGRRPERSPARHGRDPPRRGGVRQHRPRRRGAQRDEAGMRSLRALCAVLVVAAGCAALPGAAAALDPPSASCNGGGCGGWFRSSVTVSWSFNSSGATGTSGCGAATVSDDTGGATFTCTVNYGGSFVGSSVTVRKDSSPPGVTASASRGPRHERVVHESGQLQLHGGRRRLGRRVLHVGHLQRPRRGRHHRLGVVHGQRRQHRVDVAEDQVRRDAPDRRRHPGAEARCERVVQPSGRRRVGGNGRRLGHLRVLVRR